ncbi:hypothetical protein [Pelagerythrobacter sp.]|uniref:hypothetical protein n=1 Tax=Pelagerythrobacter sp. TaxID=2800702 RepID=UPI0035AE4F26
MFEGQIVPASTGSLGDSTGEDAALRVPAWPDLVARLAAGHELRRALSHAAKHPAGNFDRFGTSGEGYPERSQLLVNPDDLSHGKGLRGMVFPAASDVAMASRET